MEPSRWPTVEEWIKKTQDVCTVEDSSSEEEDRSQLDMILLPLPLEYWNSRSMIFYH